MDIEEKLVEIFKLRPAGPFLFVGSGFSRRYLGLENWRGLLDKYCVTGQPFEYYLAKSNGDLPLVAQFLAEDFNEHWWKNENYTDNVQRFKSKVTDVTSALRIEICSYLISLEQSIAKSSDYADEVALLSGLNVDGVITTNWDLFLEQVFPDYKVYIGQEELLFSNPQEIGEIYKIHGCSTRPNSLVLTKKDYIEFNDKNTYLASKLITLFVEHPIVFIGYSISDENVSGLLRAISACIGKDNIEKLRKNLIFVQRLGQNEDEGISDTYLTIDGIQIPLVLVKTDNFSAIYRAIDATKRKIPVRILRYCKEQLYELVQSSEPEKKLAVVDIDEITTKDDIEFVVGIGVASQEIVGPSPLGYASIDITELISDLLHEDKGYDAQQIVDSLLPRLCKKTPNTPVYKYLNEIGVTTLAEYEKSKICLDKVVKRDIRDFRVKSYSKAFFRSYRHKGIQDIVDECTPENASAYIPFLSRDKIDLEVLKIFLLDNEAKIDHNVSIYSSNFKKLAALYDRLKWGW